jgi:hypothetical protein
MQIMIKSPVQRDGSRKRCRAGERAQARTVVLAVVFLALGFAVGVLWYHRFTNVDNGAAASPQPAALSDATKSVLQRLQDPVEVRYYSLLDPTGASDSLKAFAGRVDQMLTEYQQESGDKLKVDRHNSQKDDSTAAFGDGLKPFNLDKGDACYLGMVVTMGTRKEVLPQLSPDWEQAVEPDLTRAIARLLEQPVPKGEITAAPVDAKAVAEVKTLIPDFANVSLEDGSKTLRAAALKDFAAAATDMASQISDAQQKLNQAQNGGSEADQQAAMKNLQELQAAEAAKLREITARSAAQIEAFKQIKSQTGGQ